ncbi:hypothetical protein BN1708_003882, partial [Verticillium longisporum]
NHDNPQDLWVEAVSTAPKILSGAKSSPEACHSIHLPASPPRQATPLAADRMTPAAVTARDLCALRVGRQCARATWNSASTPTPVHRRLQVILKPNPRSVSLTPQSNTPNLLPVFRRVWDDGPIEAMESQRLFSNLARWRFILVTICRMPLLPATPDEPFHPLPNIRSYSFSVLNRTALVSTLAGNTIQAATRNQVVSRPTQCSSFAWHR